MKWTIAQRMTIGYAILIFVIVGQAISIRISSYSTGCNVRVVETGGIGAVRCHSDGVGKQVGWRMNATWRR